MHDACKCFWSLFSSTNVLKLNNMFFFINFECYHFQFHVLREVYNLFLFKRSSRFRRYFYSTFEFELFCDFSSIIIDRANLTKKLFLNDIKNKSNLTCRFCCFNFSKIFDNITTLWNHIVYQHQIIKNDIRFHEIQHCASFWRIYWKFHSKNDECNNFIMIKVIQTNQKNFCWKNVLRWSLHWDCLYTFNIITTSRYLWLTLRFVSWISSTHKCDCWNFWETTILFHFLFDIFSFFEFFFVARS